MLCVILFASFWGLRLGNILIPLRGPGLKTFSQRKIKIGEELEWDFFYVQIS